MYIFYCKYYHEISITKYYGAFEVALNMFYVINIYFNICCFTKNSVIIISIHQNKTLKTIF